MFCAVILIHLYTSSHGALGPTEAFTTLTSVTLLQYPASSFVLFLSRVGQVCKKS